MSITDTATHQPEPWFWGADSDQCPHGAKPDVLSDEYDVWAEQHQGSPQDVFICLDAPAGDVCGACTEDHNEAVPWSACDARTHVRPRQGAVPVPAGEHRPLTLESGPGDCIERECEEYYNAEDGEPILSVTSCSHLTDVVVCGGCTAEPTDDGLYFATVAWPCPAAVAAGSAV